MRFIQIPETVSFIPSDIQIKAGLKEREIPFLETLCELWLNNTENFGKAAGVRAGVRIDAAFRGKSPKDWVEIEEADYDLLTKAVNSVEYNPSVMRQLLSYIDAVTEAKKEDPRKAATKEKDTKDSTESPSAKAS